MRTRISRIDRRIVRPLAHGLHRVHRATLRHPAVPVATAGLVIVSVSPLVSRMPVALSIRDAVDPRSRSVDEIERSDASFGESDSFLLLLRPGHPTDGFGRDESSAIQEWIDDLRSDPEVLHVLSPLDLRRVGESGDSLRVEPRLTDLTASSLQTLRGSPWQGVLTDQECRDAAVEISLQPDRGRFGRYDPTVVDRIVTDARQRLGQPDGRIEVHAAGVAAFEAESVRGIRRFRLLNLGVVVVLLTLTRLALGTWRAGILLLVPVVTASAVVYGGMYLRGDPIDMLSTGLFLLLAVAAIEDFYFLSHLRSKTGSRWRAPFRRQLLPGMLTSLTTVLGFGSLLASDLAIVRRLGLWASTGAVVEWAATFLVLPSLLAVCPGARNWTDPARAVGTATLERLSSLHWPRPVGLALLAVLALGASGGFHLNFDDSPDRTFSRHSGYSAATRELRASRGWTGSFWIVAPPRADDPVDDYESEWVVLDDALRLLRTWPEVAAVLDPGAAVDDLTAGRRSRLDRLATLRSTGQTLDVAGLAAPDGSLRARVFVRDVDLADVTTLRDFVRGLGERSGIYPAGELIAYSEFSQSVPRALLHSLVTCLVLVGAVLALAVRARGVPVLPVLATAAWGPAFVLGVIAVLAVPVNFLTCVFAGVLVGLTGDNALQYVFARDRGSIAEGAAARGAASIRIALVMSACSLVFVGSAFVASRRLGLVLGLGLVASLVGDLWILRSLLRDRSAS